MLEIVLFQTTCSNGKHLREFVVLEPDFPQLTGDDDIEIGINTEEIWTDEKAGTVVWETILEISFRCSNLEWEQNQSGTKPKLKQIRGRMLCPSIELSIVRGSTRQIYMHWRVHVLMRCPHTP